MCLKPDGVFALVYTHGSVQGWEAIIQAYRARGLWITGVQPLSIERRHRPRAMRSDAVNSCVSFIAHRTDRHKTTISLDRLSDDMRALSRSLSDELTEMRWSEADIAIVAYAHGVAYDGSAHSDDPANRNRHCGADGHVYGDIDADRDADRGAHGDAHAHIHCDGHTDRDAYGHAHGYEHAVDHGADPTAPAVAHPASVRTPRQ